MVVVKSSLFQSRSVQRATENPQSYTLTWGCNGAKHDVPGSLKFLMTVRNSRCHFSNTALRQAWCVCVCVNIMGLVRAILTLKPLLTFNLYWCLVYKAWNVMLSAHGVHPPWKYHFPTASQGIVVDRWKGYLRTNSHRPEMPIFPLKFEWIL